MTRAVIIAFVLAGCVGPAPCEPDGCNIECSDAGSALGVCLSDVCECVDPDGGTFRSG